jgi:uncharacterized membrane protein required for colicin V production
MSLPFSSQQCFVVVMLAFIVLGFWRGWRRELISLVAVLLAFFLVRPESSGTVGQFLTRLPNTVSYMFTGSASAASSQAPQIPAATTNSMAPFWSLLLFAGIIALGYYISVKAFPKPSTPHERLIGIVPAVISGGFVLAYLGSYFSQGSGGTSNFSVNVQSPNPADYIPVFFFVIIVALVVALIFARTRKSAPAKK